MKVRLMEQVAFAARDELQVVADWAKSAAFGPLMAIEEMATAAL